MNLVLRETGIIALLTAGFIIYTVGYFDGKRSNHEKLKDLEMKVDILESGKNS